MAYLPAENESTLFNEAQGYLPLLLRNLNLKLKTAEQKRMTSDVTT
jgi:hypothetical protein